ncbi:Siderophore iron transporter 1 [Lasiodiplodia theobromae]|uniref:Siderophore iron transporter 1 n=1 Tax=Lasiodiplodia theobromae TaxID=45133 RepID=A0A5N5D6M7_9PEZI|nr:Siderophore iron transporter 1 [Lasiodiplodia theobromae]
MEEKNDSPVRNKQAINVALLSQEEADQLRSQALSSDRATLPAGYYSSIRIVGTFVGIAISLVATYFAYQAGASVIISINNDIGPSENSSLFAIVWSAAQPISVLLFGSLSDRFGRRNWALAAMLLGIVGGAVAATAKTMNTLIGAMVLLGLASGVPASYPLLTGELATNKGKFLATVTVVVPNIIATGFGPYIGQRLVVYATWRWIFYIYIIMMVPATVCFYLWYHPPTFVQLHGHNFKCWDAFKRIDFVGVFLLTAGLTLFLLGVSWGGTTTALTWDSPRILGLLISGILCCIAFVLYECFVPVFPIVPMRFFRDVRGFACINVMSAVFGCINIAVFILWPSQVIHIFGSTGSWEQTAWMSCTVNFGIWTGIIIVGPLYHIIKHIRWQLVVATAWMSIFLGVLTTANSGQRAAAIAVSFLSCLPIGWGEVVTMLLVQYLVDDKDLGAAFAVTSANRTILGCIFTSVFSAILTNKLPQQLSSKLVPNAIAAGLPESSVPGVLAAVAAGNDTALSLVPGMNDPAVLKAVNEGASNAWAGSYAYVYYCALALGLCSVIAAFFTRDMDKYLTGHISRQIYTKDEGAVDVLEKVENS